MKKKRKEPVFNIEMQHHLRQLVLKRGHLIRSQRTRTIFATHREGAKSWLEARLIPASGEEPVSNWTKAHELAAKINRELRTDVYVEPASKHGRYNAIATGKQVQSSAAEDDSDESPFHTPKQSVAPVPANFGPPSLGIRGFSHGAAISPFSFGSHGMSLPNTPDPAAHMHSFLPPEVQELIGEKTSAENGNLKCPFLYELPGWSELPDNKRKMFETEAAQLTYGGLRVEPGENLPAPNLSNLEALKLQPKISRQLKGFLESATAATS